VGKYFIPREVRYFDAYKWESEMPPSTTTQRVAKWLELLRSNANARMDEA
jgi:hypothetical protein